MSDAAIQAISAIIIAAIGIVTTTITVRGRTSHDKPDAAPVTNQQVLEAEDPGVSALRIALSTQKQLEKTQADLEQVRGELRSVLSELESIARDLRAFVEWEEAGAHGQPPVSLPSIYERLEALTRKRPHP